MEHTSCKCTFCLTWSLFITTGDMSAMIRGSRSDGEGGSPGPVQVSKP